MAEKSSQASVLHIISGLGDGGAQSVLYNLCCSSNNFRHIVVSLRDGGKYEAMLCAAGVEVVNLNLGGDIRSLFELGKLYKLIKARRPNIVQTWMYHADLIGGLIARLAGVRAVCWGIRHSTLDKNINKSTTLLVAKICAFLSNWLPATIVCCAFSAREVHREYGYAGDKMVVIQNGVDTRRFQPRSKSSSLMNALDLDGSVPLIGSVARYDPQKDHLTLLRALSNLKKEGVTFKCMLVGNGLTHSNQDLTSEIRALNLQNHIVLLGSRSDVPDLMNLFDVHVMSSSHGEGFPNVVGEAMASGTFAVSTDCGDAASIHGSEGIVVATSNVDALADGILRALDILESDNYESLSRKSRSRVVASFGLAAMVANYENLWTNCASEVV